ncbi:MAG: DUF2156 domain-containing protein [Alphaproteobacteria bacterium]|nr:DUF2156 domain-containing protein [Alphaproteobacteria bacterium]
MGALSYEFLKQELTGSQKAKPDSYQNSPLYYTITGRKGARLYKSKFSSMVVCEHPHIEQRLMVFPEIGKADYELTASVLNMIDPPKNGVQLARYSAGELETLKRKLENLNYSAVSGVSIVEEHVMDWRYPVHVLDTAKVQALEGKEFKQIRKKFRKAAEHITHIPLNQDNALRLMRATLKFWEGNMIANEKDTDDMSEFYLELFKIMDENPGQVNGLFFMQGRRPVGFTVWDQTAPDISNCFVNLGDTSITGLSDYQMVSVCQDLNKRGIRYLNIGGSEIKSLDDFKIKYQPAESVELLSADVLYRRVENVNISAHTLVESSSYLLP